MVHRANESDLNTLWRSWSARPSRFAASGIGCLWALLGLLMLITLERSFVLVGAGERAVIFNRFTGTQPYQLGEGLHFVWPWVQLPTLYDIKTRAYTMRAAGGTEPGQEGEAANDALTALTADGLAVSLELSVLFHVDPNNVWHLHREIGPGYVEKIVRPQSRAYVRMIVARYPVVEVYGGGRTRIADEINTRLRELFAKSYLVLDEVLLRDVRFSKEFHDAIEQKQVAQQEVQRMHYVLDQADKERRQKIIEAEGEAESIRMKAAALSQNPQLVGYEYVRGLPDNVRTVVTDGRTVVSIGDPLRPGALAETVVPRGRDPRAEQTEGSNDNR
jgi:prohibitin 2